MSGKGIAPPVRQQVLGKGYPVFSWYSIMAGMGIFPDPGSPARPDAAERLPIGLTEIDNLLERSAAQLPRSPRGAREYSAAPHRRQPADLLLVTMPIREFSALDAAAIRRDVLPDKQPAVLRGLRQRLARRRAGAVSPAALVRYLRRFDSGTRRCADDGARNRRPDLLQRGHDGI